MPIGQRQYQLAIALAGQRMSYQDNTYYKGSLDECVNKHGAILPFGRFAALSADANDPQASIVLPSATDTTIVGLIPQQGFYEEDEATGLVGIPIDYPVAYAYKGVFAVEAQAAVTRGQAIEICADATDAANQGKVAPTGTYTPNSIAMPASYRVVKYVNNLAIIEIDFPSTLLS